MWTTTVGDARGFAGVTVAIVFVFTTDSDDVEVDYSRVRGNGKVTPLVVAYGDSDRVVSAPLRLFLIYG